MLFGFCGELVDLVCFVVVAGGWCCSVLVSIFDFSFHIILLNSGTTCCDAVG